MLPRRKYRYCVNYFLAIIIIICIGNIHGKSHSEQIEELHKSSSSSQNHYTTSPRTIDDRKSDESGGTSQTSLHGNIASSTTSYNGNETNVDNGSSDSSQKEDVLQRILPKVRFNCSGRTEGYYADRDFNCEVFHYCKTNGFRFTFVCPPKSQFNQKTMTCDYGTPLCSKQDSSSPSANQHDSIRIITTTTTTSTASSLTGQSAKPHWFSDDPGSGSSSLPPLRSGSSMMSDLISYESLKNHQSPPFMSDFGTKKSAYPKRGENYQTSTIGSITSPKSDDLSPIATTSSSSVVSIEGDKSNSDSQKHHHHQESSTSIDDGNPFKPSIGDPLPMYFSSPMPDMNSNSSGGVDSSSLTDSNNNGFKPVFVPKQVKKFSTVPPAILEITAGDNSGKVILTSPTSTPSIVKVSGSNESQFGASGNKKNADSVKKNDKKVSLSNSKKSSDKRKESERIRNAAADMASKMSKISFNSGSNSGGHHNRLHLSSTHYGGGGGGGESSFNMHQYMNSLNGYRNGGSVGGGRSPSKDMSSSLWGYSQPSGTFGHVQSYADMLSDFSTMPTSSEDGGVKIGSNWLKYPYHYSSSSPSANHFGHFPLLETNGITHHHNSIGPTSPSKLTSLQMPTTQFLHHFGPSPSPFSSVEIIPTTSTPLPLGHMMYAASSNGIGMMSNGTISTALLENQAQKFAHLARKNLERATSIRNNEMSPPIVSDIPPFYNPFFEHSHSGQRSSVVVKNPALQEKFVQDKEKMFKKLRQQYLRNHVRKRLEEQMKNAANFHKSLQSSSNNNPSSSLLGMANVHHHEHPVKNLLSSASQSSSGPISMTASASSPTAAATSVQQQQQQKTSNNQAVIQGSNSMSSMTALEPVEDAEKYPQFFYGLPKLSPKTNTQKYEPLMQSLSSDQSSQMMLMPSYLSSGSTGSSQIAIDGSNFGPKKNSMNYYRLPIGTRPQSGSSSSSNSNPFVRLNWFGGNSKNNGPDNFQTSASVKSPMTVQSPDGMTFSGLFDSSQSSNGISQSSQSSSQQQQSSPLTRRIPFLSQISKFFSNSPFSRTGSLLSQITQKSSLFDNSDSMTPLSSGVSSLVTFPINNRFSNPPIPITASQQQQQNSLNLPSSFFTNTDDFSSNSQSSSPSFVSSQFSQLINSNDQSDSDTSSASIKRFSPSWEESFASAYMLQPPGVPDIKRSDSSSTGSLDSPYYSSYYKSIPLSSASSQSTTTTTEQSPSTSSEESYSSSYSSSPASSSSNLNSTILGDHDEINSKQNQSEKSTKVIGKNARRKRSIGYSKPEYRFSPFAAAATAYPIIKSLFSGLRSQESPSSYSAFLRPNPSKYNFQYAPIMSESSLSPAILASLQAHHHHPHHHPSSSPTSPHESASYQHPNFLATSLRPVYARPFAAHNGFSIALPSLISPTYSSFEHPIYGFDGTLPLAASAASLPLEEESKEKFWFKSKLFHNPMVGLRQPELSAPLYSSIDLNELHEYDSPPLFEAFTPGRGTSSGISGGGSSGGKEKGSSSDDNSDFRPVSLHKPSFKRPPKREKVPGQSDDTKYADTSSNPSHDDKKYYRKLPKAYDQKLSINHGPTSPQTAESSTGPSQSPSPIPSNSIDEPRGSDLRTREREGRRRPSLPNKEYVHFASSIDHSADDNSYEDQPIDFNNLVPPYMKAPPNDPGQKIEEKHRPNKEYSRPKQSNSNNDNSNEELRVSEKYKSDIEHHNRMKHSHELHHARMRHPPVYSHPSPEDGYIFPGLYPPMEEYHPANAIRETTGPLSGPGFKLEAIEDEYDYHKNVKDDASGEQQRGYGYQPDNQLRWPFGYENTKVFINDHGPTASGEAFFGHDAASQEYYDKFKNKGFRPHFPEYNGGVQKGSKVLGRDKDNKNSKPAKSFKNQAQDSAENTPRPSSPTETMKFSTISPPKSPSAYSPTARHRNPESSRGSGHQTINSSGKYQHGSESSTPSSEKSNIKADQSGKKRPGLTKIRYEYKPNKPSAYQPKAREPENKGDQYDDKAAFRDELEPPVSQSTPHQSLFAFSTPKSPAVSSPPPIIPSSVTPTTITEADVDSSSYGARINSNSNSVATSTSSPGRIPAKRSNSQPKSSYNMNSKGIAVSSSAPISSWEDHEKKNVNAKSNRKQAIEAQKNRIKQLMAERTTSKPETKKSIKIEISPPQSDNPQVTERKLKDISYGRELRFNKVTDINGEKDKENSSKESRSSSPPKMSNGHTNSRSPPSSRTGANKPPSYSTSSSSSISSSSSSSSSSAAAAAAAAISLYQEERKSHHQSNESSIASTSSSASLVKNKTPKPKPRYLLSTTRRPSAYASTRNSTEKNVKHFTVSPSVNSPVPSSSSLPMPSTSTAPSIWTGYVQANQQKSMGTKESTTTTTTKQSPTRGKFQRRIPSTTVDSSPSPYSLYSYSSSSATGKGVSTQSPLASSSTSTSTPLSTSGNNSPTPFFMGKIELNQSNKQFGSMSPSSSESSSDGSFMIDSGNDLTVKSSSTTSSPVTTQAYKRIFSSSNGGGFQTRPGTSRSQQNKAADASKKQSTGETLSFSSSSSSVSVSSSISSNKPPKEAT